MPRQGGGRGLFWPRFPALVALLAGLSCSPQRSPDAPRALVLIVIDTLRADRLGSAGYALARTPHLDALASRGIRFTEAVTPVPVTLPAVSSLLTGRYPFRHGVRDNEWYVLPPEEITIAERLREAGFRTAAVVASGIVAADRGLDQGFEHYDDRFTGPYPTYRNALAPFAAEFAENRRRADVVTDLALARIEAMGDDPFFLLVHYFDVHSYYDPPPRYAEMHPGRPYDGEITFVDAEIGRLLERLDRRPDAAVVVVSDHGEGLGEHGEPEHGFLLYRSTLAVPVIAAGPGIPRGTVRRDPLSLIDLEPTLAAWLGLPDCDSPRDGRALAWDRPEGEDAPLYAETCRTLISYGWSELRSLQRGEYKLIHGPADELYRVSVDPEETRDLGEIDPAPALLRELTQVTGGETRSDILARRPGAIDPARREMLESLGYVGSSGASATGGDYPHPREELPRWLEAQEHKAVYRRAVTLAAGGHPREAIALFDSVLSLEPDRADVYYNRGLARQALGDGAGYLADLDRALRADPDYVPALAATARRDAEAGRDESAQAVWLRVLEIEPGHLPALRAVSDRHLKRGETEAALPYLRMLVNALPEDPDVRFNLGLAALRSGRLPEAENHLGAFLRLAPEDPRVPAVRQALAEER